MVGKHFILLQLETFQERSIVIEEQWDFSMVGRELSVINDVAIDYKTVDHIENLVAANIEVLEGNFDEILFF